MTEDEMQIRNLLQRWHAASAAGDTLAVLEMISDDAVFLIPGRPAMSKQDFASLSASPLGTPLPKMQITQRIHELEVVGDLATLWSELRVEVTPTGAAHSVIREGHTLTIFKKRQGRWWLARDANLMVIKSPSP